MRGPALLLLLAGMAFGVATSGCAQLESTRKYLTTNDYKDGSEDADDDWSVVRKEGRGNKAPEVEVDGWFDRWFHSPKYHEINRNLGYVPN